MLAAEKYLEKAAICNECLFVCNRDTIYPHTFFRLKTRLVEMNDRKITMDAAMENCITGKLVAESTTLLIVIKKTTS